MSLFVFNNGECEYSIYHRQTDKQTDVGPNRKKITGFDTKAFQHNVQIKNINFNKVLAE